MATMWSEITATVAEGADVSSSFVTGDYQQGSVQFPAAMDSVGVVFQRSNDGSTWDTARQDAEGQAVMSSVVIAADKTIDIHKSCFKAKYCRLKFPTPETAARSLRVLINGV